LINSRCLTIKISANAQLTRLIIAHRPETIAGAQRIVQLEEGRLVEVMRAAEGTKGLAGEARGVLAPA